MALHQSTKLSIKSARLVASQSKSCKYMIKQAQQHMTALSDKLSSTYVPFDNTVKPDTCVDVLVSHRIVSQFHVHDSTRDTDLQAQAFSKYVDFDNLIPNVLDISLSPDLRRARTLLRRWFLDFNVDIKNARYRVTPGETYISSQGEVSILAKLYDKRHWTTTANCLSDTCEFIYNNLAFKRAAKKHIGKLSRRDKRRLYFRFKNSPDIGYDIFSFLLVDRVLTIVDGARASTVPKNNEKRRFINVEAMFPVILQRLVASEILLILKREGNDLGNTHTVSFDERGVCREAEQSAQKLHGIMISDRKYSTIDFSNASDSVSCAAVSSLFPKRVADLLFKYRSHYVLIDGSLHAPKKLSSMGNGFTFEVMTAMLFAVGRGMTHDVRVYGDDVILPNSCAHRFVTACSLIGFKTNESKTFISSFFRESCGYFYSDHINDYIISYDFNQILSVSDIIITHNKLASILDAGQISHDLYRILEHTRDQLNALAHASRKGPLPVGLYNQRKYLSLYMYDSGYSKKQRRNKVSSTLYHYYVTKNASFFEACQASRTDVSLVLVPFFIPARSKWAVLKDGNPVLLPALYAGRSLSPVVKGKGKWVDIPAFVASDGTLTLVTNLSKQKTAWVDRLKGVTMAHLPK